MEQLDMNAIEDLAIDELESLDAPGGWGDFWGGAAGAAVGLGAAYLILT